jgi:hypothetical protein
MFAAARWHHSERKVTKRHDMVTSSDTAFVLTTAKNSHRTLKKRHKETKQKKTTNFLWNTMNILIGF